VIAQIARDEGITGIIGQVLNIPVTCHPDYFPVSKYEYNSYVQNADAPIVNSATMRFFWNNYLPTAGPDPRASPLLAPSLTRLPPTRS
jgi:acetyl esterase/lipase